MSATRVAGILVLAGTLASAHRLDEYLQGAIISVEENRLQLQMTLTPGVAIFPFLISTIDRDRDGVISKQEQRAYASRVLDDVALTIDEHRLTPLLSSIRFPTLDEMKEGRGEIQLEFDVDLPRGGRNRKFTFENHHQSGISAYQVNVLVPRDPETRITAQHRDYSQSHYELEYEQNANRSDPPLFTWRSGRFESLGTIALFLSALLVFLGRQRAWSARAVNCPHACTQAKQIDVCVIHPSGSGNGSGGHLQIEERDSHF